MIALGKKNEGRYGGVKRGERTRGVPVMRRLNRWAWAEILAALLLLVAVLASWWTTERRETEAEISYLLSVYGDQRAFCEVFAHKLC